MFKRENPNHTKLIVVSVIFVVFAALCWMNGGEKSVELFMEGGNPAFLAAYDKLDSEPLGCGAQGCTWAVIKKGDKTKTVLVAKSY